VLAAALPVTPLGQRLPSLRGSAGKRLRGAQELATCPASLIDDLLEGASAPAEVDAICVDPDWRTGPAVKPASGQSGHPGAAL